MLVKLSRIEVSTYISIVINLGLRILKIFKQYSGQLRVSINTEGSVQIVSAIK